jgi:hypothetical protein
MPLRGSLWRPYAGELTGPAAGALGTRLITETLFFYKFVPINLVEIRNLREILHKSVSNAALGACLRCILGSGLRYRAIR